jgi:GAF domain-containing protein
LEAVITSSQELSSIVEVNQLCNTLLTIVVKNAGATKGVLLFEKDGVLVIESAILGSDTSTSLITGNAWALRGMIYFLEPVPLGENSSYASASVINYCWRTGKAVVVGEVYRTDPYSEYFLIFLFLFTSNAGTRT